jgi:hypothetical protein
MYCAQQRIIKLLDHELRSSARMKAGVRGLVPRAKLGRHLVSLEAFSRDSAAMEEARARATSTHSGVELQSPTFNRVRTLC